MAIRRITVDITEQLSDQSKLNNPFITKRQPLHPLPPYDTAWFCQSKEETIYFFTGVLKVLIALAESLDITPVSGMK